MNERRRQLVIDKDELTEVISEIIEKTSFSNSGHFCRLSQEERQALKELSKFLQRVDNTKWAFGVAVIIGMAMFCGGALWVGIKQLVRTQQ